MRKLYKKFYILHSQKRLVYVETIRKSTVTNFGVHESLKLYHITVGLVQVFTKLHKLKMCFVHAATITGRVNCRRFNRTIAK
jgi:hypothetical protein